MSYKVNDCVYKELTLPDYALEIINTKEFQRLHNLKQLGVSNFVFKTADHQRAEHCIGTAYLCSQLLQILERNSCLQIDALHKKCVILAGLLHDIGHGPFSHLWEGVVHEGSDKSWTHEQQSVQIIEQLIQSNNIRLHESDKCHSKALRLITSLITGDCEAWSELLNPEEMFITEIVNNKFCNIDVDKCDYILRDEQHVGDTVTIKPFIDFLQRARVVYEENGTSHIGYHMADFELIENMFYNRAYLHMNIYQHWQVAGVEKMVKDICIRSAAGGMKVANLPLTEVHQDHSAYIQLDDTVLDIIKNTKTDNKLVCEAQTILENLTERRFYRKVWESSDCEAKTVHETLVKKFGPIFCIVRKLIPNAEVPSNVPLYNDNGDNVNMTSDLKLSYQSSIIFCEDPDEVVLYNVKNFIDSLKNNNI